MTVDGCSMIYGGAGPKADLQHSGAKRRFGLGRSDRVVSGRSTRCVQKSSLACATAPPACDLSRIEGAPRAQVIRADQRASANRCQKVLLTRLQGHEPAEHVQQVDQLCRVFREPAPRLYAAKHRRLSSVSDDWPRTVQASIAEPLGQHTFPGHFILPHCARHVVNVAGANLQPTSIVVVLQSVGEVTP